MKDLKLCPFCGGEARIKSKTLNGRAYVWVECTECDAMTGLTTFFDMPRRMTADDPNIKRVMEKWNRRAE